ncbi:MAG: hypothetical protein LW823_09915 [Rickettsiales bacterium]|jgi:hypothetical protein|nr:hypothetical protein [Rickettsiales bacterium]
MNNPWNDPGDRLDRPVLTPELAAQIEKRASKPLTAEGQQALSAKLAAVAKEQEEKRNIPRLSLPENKARLFIATHANEKDGDLIREFKEWLDGFASGPLTYADVRNELVQGFAAIITALDQDNHQRPEKPGGMRASDRAVLELRDRIMALPVVAESNFPRETANGLTGQIIRPAIAAAGRLGITRPSISKDLFLRETQGAGRY